MPEEQQSQWVQPGATVRPTYTMWCPIVYVIPETSLQELSHLNTEATVFFSVGSSLFSIAVAILLASIFEVTLTPIASVLTWFGAPLCAVLGLVFYGLGFNAIRTKTSKLTTIKSESKIIENPE